MWAVSPTTVVFVTNVKERPDAMAISSAAVEFQAGMMQLSGAASSPTPRL